MYSGKIILRKNTGFEYPASKSFKNINALYELLKSCKSKEDLLVIVNKFHLWNYKWREDTDCNEFTRFKFCDILGNVYFLIIEKNMSRNFSFSR